MKDEHIGINLDVYAGSAACLRRHRNPGKRKFIGERIKKLFGKKFDGNARFAAIIKQNYAFRLISLFGFAFFCFIFHDKSVPATMMVEMESFLLIPPPPQFYGL